MLQRMTHDMTRLRAAMTAGHNSRQQLRRHLVESHRSLQRDTDTMLARLRRTNADMFKLERAARTAFVAGVAQQASSLRTAFRADLQGARRAWLG